MADQHYANFPPDGPCDGPLPAHLVRDEYIFVQLAPMEAMRDGKPAGSLKMPPDLLAPERVDQLHHQYPEVPYDVFGKAPGIWFESWQAPIEPPPPEFAVPRLLEVRVDDVGSFIARPNIDVGAEGVPTAVVLHPENVRDLLEGQATIARLRPADGNAEEAKLVRIAPFANKSVPQFRPTLGIGNVEEFLATGTITIDGRRGQANLTATNVAELTSGGATALNVSIDGANSIVFAMAGDGLTMPGIPLPNRQVSLLASPAPDMREAVAGPLRSYRESRPLSVAMLARPSELAEAARATFHVDGALAFFLPYRVTWELLGYTRGELLSSVSLAPEEETTVEIISWDRRKQTVEDSIETEGEVTFESSLSAKLSAECVKELVNQHDWGLTAKGDVSLPISNVQVGASGAWNDTKAVTDTHKGTVAVAIEGLRKVTSKMRTSHQTKVTESREVGFDRKVSRRITNANKCHTLDLDYFEILASYRISMTTILDQARVCLLIDTPIKDAINRAFVLAYESELRQALLAPEHVKGFAAVRTLMALEHLHAYECLVRCPEPCPCDSPGLSSAGIAPAALGANPATSGDPVAKAAADVKAAAAAIRERIKTLRDADIFRDHMQPNSQHVPSSGICALARDVFGRHPALEWEEAKVEWRRWLFRELHLVRHASGFWSEALRYLNDNDDTPARLEILQRAGDFGWATALGQVAAFIGSALTISGHIATITAECSLNTKPLLENLGFDDGGLDGAIKQAATALQAYTAATTTAGAEAVIKDPKLPAAVGNGSGGEPTAGQATAYDPKALAEARVVQDALFAHLTTHQSYYRQAIWAALSTDDRVLHLQLYDNVTRHVEPHIVGFLGGRAAFPLRLDQHPDIANWLEQIVRTNPALLDAPEPITVTVPTNGVTLGTRLGQCSACEEFIEGHRVLDLAAKSTEVDLAKEQLQHAKLTSKRFAARLAMDPPDLNDPEVRDGQPVRIQLIDERALR